MIVAPLPPILPILPVLGLSHKSWRPRSRDAGLLCAELEVDYPSRGLCYPEFPHLKVPDGGIPNSVRLGREVPEVAGGGFQEPSTGEP